MSYTGPKHLNKFYCDTINSWSRSIFHLFKCIKHFFPQNGPSQPVVCSSDRWGVLVFPQK